MGTVGTLQRRVAIGVLLAASTAAVSLLVLLPGGARSAPLAAAANLDQCRNGASTSPANCVDTDPNVGWVNGNAGSTNSHYVEGHSIPYRATLTEIPTGSAVTLTLGYDIKHSGKHALDYLTHFDRLEPHAPFGHVAEAIDPLSGVSGVSSTISTFQIPVPSSAGSPVAGQPTNSFASLPVGERVMTLYGGSIDGISYVTQGDLTAAQAETQIAVTFTADSPTAVFAWGGHIASSSDWGAGNSASAVSGSPYHMRLISWSLDGLGQQDRSLQADAVFGTIEIVKNTIGGDATFGYSTTTGQGGGGLPGTFDLTTSGGTASRTFAVVGRGALYTVTEASLPASWSLQDLECDDPDNGDEGTTVDLGTKTATMVVNASEQIVCTFTNAFTKLTPSVTTDVHDGQHAVITSAAIGSTVHDKATVSGSGPTPTGTVDFTVWLGNATCSGEGSSAGSNVALVGGVADPSESKVVPAGGLSFRAHYDGDAVYEPGDGPCEPLAATKLVPTVTTDVHDAQHAVITSAAIGSTVHDKATVSGSGPTPTGTVDFTVWLGNTTCSGEGSSAGNDVALVAGAADPSTSQVVPAGGLSFRAHYDGDLVYEPGDGPCEPLVALTGTIIVEKQTSPNGVAGTFTFSSAAAGSIGDNGQITVSGLAPGTYTSTEASAQGFILTAISCSDTNSSGNLGTRTATFVVEAGEVVKCTFTNAQQVAGRGAISVSKSASPTTLKEPGGPVTFSVTITNTSLDVMVTIDNVVDDKFGDLDDSGGNGCFDVPINLAPGQSVNCTFSRQITGVGGTSHVNTVTVTGHDPAGNTLRASDDARVDITPRLIDLVIVKEASSPTPLNGIVNYSLTVTNKGPDTATDVQVADPAPAGITYLSASPSQGSCSLGPALVTCSLGTIAPGQTVTIAITARATTVGSHTNTATVTGSGGRETNPADNVDSAVTIVPAPLKPPVVKPAPAPCLALTVSPQMIKADGKADRLSVKVTAGKKRMRGVTVVVSGAGLKRSALSNGKGLAVLRVNPRKAGIVTITAREPNQKVCGAKRIGVVGVFLPPVTG